MYCIQLMKTRYQFTNINKWRHVTSEKYIYIYMYISIIIISYHILVKNKYFINPYFYGALDFIYVIRKLVPSRLPINSSAKTICIYWNVYFENVLLFYVIIIVYYVITIWIETIGVTVCNMYTYWYYTVTCANNFQIKW